MSIAQLGAESMQGASVRQAARAFAKSVMLKKS
jgi:hypothetical protein